MQVCPFVKTIKINFSSYLNAYWQYDASDYTWMHIWNHTQSIDVAFSEHGGYSLHGFVNYLGGKMNNCITHTDVFYSPFHRDDSVSHEFSIDVCHWSHKCIQNTCSLSQYEFSVHVLGDWYQWHMIAHIGCTSAFPPYAYISHVFADYLFGECCNHNADTWKPSHSPHVF